MRSILAEMVGKTLQAIQTQGIYLLGFENLQTVFPHSNVGVVLDFFFQLCEKSFVVFVIKIAIAPARGIGFYKTSSKGCSLGITRKLEVVIEDAVGKQTEDYLLMFVCDQ